MMPVYGVWNYRDVERSDPIQSAATAAAARNSFLKRERRYIINLR
jgi:hypothetical protein